MELVSDSNIRKAGTQGLAPRAKVGRCVARIPQAPLPREARPLRAAPPRAAPRPGNSTRSLGSTSAGERLRRKVQCRTRSAAGVRWASSLRRAWACHWALRRARHAGALVPSADPQRPSQGVEWPTKIVSGTRYKTPLYLVRGSGGDTTLRGGEERRGGLIRVLLIGDNG